MKSGLAGCCLICLCFGAGCFSGSVEGSRNVGGPAGRGRVLFVDVSVDQDDCRSGWMSMDVLIEIGTERGKITRRFSPSCAFSFSEDFTDDGVRCSIRSGMCTNFMDAGHMEFRCRGDEGFEQSASANFPCR